MVDWTSFGVVSNRNGVVEWQHTGISQPREFFRVVAE